MSNYVLSDSDIRSIRSNNLLTFIQDSNQHKMHRVQNQIQICLEASWEKS